MKKRIIIPIAILLISGSLCAQDNAPLNPDGTTGTAYQRSTNVESNHIKIDVANANPDGTVKSVTQVNQPYTEKSIKVNLDNVNTDGTPKGSVKPQYIPASPQPAQTTDDFSYRTKGDIANPALNGKNENAPRISKSDIQDNSLIGTNDDPVTKKGTATENNSAAASIRNTSTFVIPESDRHLSDIELNKKYPDRNTTNVVKPATGNNNGISDKEMQKLAPKSESKPANTTPLKHKLTGDELNRKK